MPPKLRYELYIPTYYNDGSPIESKKHREIKNKIIDKFGAISVHPGSISGTWIHPNTGVIYYDNNFKFEITVEKSSSNEEFFETFKEFLKEFLQQQQIYIIYTEVIQI